MDSAADYISNLTLYDIKSAVRKVQNVVMNFTEMEALVREATNNEPWGASSTQLSEIAEGTHNYTHFNEIMAMIYRRFTEKSAEEWRQIYKALQLLEYLVKNGSERVIDDARSHISTIKMLRNFHYTDEKMKDQGINVRNRAKELTELLQDSEAIRNERRKAKANNKKFGAVSSESAFTSGQSGGFGGTGKKYGGFSSEEYGSGSSGAIYGDGGGFTPTSSAGRVYGDGGGTSGSQSGAYGEAASTRSGKSREERPRKSRAAVGFAEDALGSVAAPAERFDDYDEYEVGSSSGTKSSAKTTVPKPIPKKDVPKPKEVDLLSMDDDTPAPPQASKPLGKTALPALQTTQDDDDDFDDFQSASTSVAAPQPLKAASLMNVMGPPSPLKTSFTSPPAQSSTFSSISSPPIPQYSGLSTLSTPASSTVPKPSGPNYYASGLFQTQTQGNTITPVISTNTQTKPKIANDAFGDLLAAYKKPATKQTESLSEMNKKSANAGLYGQTSMTPAVQDDEFGEFSSSKKSAPAPAAGNSNSIDLLF